MLFYLRNVSKGYTKYWLFWKGYSVWNMLRNSGTLYVKATLLFIPMVFYFKFDTTQNFQERFSFSLPCMVKAQNKKLFKKHWPEIYFPKWQPFPNVDSNYWGFQFDHKPNYVNVYKKSNWSKLVQLISLILSNFPSLTLWIQINNIFIVHVLLKWNIY